MMKLKISILVYYVSVLTFPLLAQTNQGLAGADDKSMREQQLKQVDSLETKEFEDLMGMMGRLLPQAELAAFKKDFQQGTDQPGVRHFTVIGAVSYLSDVCNAGNDWRKDIDQMVELQVPPSPMRTALKKAAEDGGTISQKHLKGKKVDCTKISKQSKVAN
jgi:predicted secreted protein